MLVQGIDSKNGSKPVVDIFCGLCGNNDTIYKVAEKYDEIVFYCGWCGEVSSITNNILKEENLSSISNAKLI